MFVISYGSATSLYTGIDVYERLLEHGAGLYDLSGK